MKRTIPELGFDRPKLILRYVLTASLVSLLIAILVCEQPVSATDYSSTAQSIEWQQEYGAGSSIQTMIPTSDGGYALAGTAMNIVIGGVAPWLIKVDSLGNKQWEQFYFDKKMNVNLGGASSIVETTDGGYALAGGSFLFKTNSTGDLQWRRFFGNAIVSSLVKSGDGYALTGSQNSYLWLARVDSVGQVIWNYTYGKAGAFGTSLTQTSDGGYAIAGPQNGTAYVAKTNSAGIMLWDQTYSRPKSSLNSIVQTRDGGLALAGVLIDLRNPVINSLVLLIKTDPHGEALWNQTYSGGEAWSVIQTNDGGFALACGYLSLGSLVKTDSTGNLQWNLTLPASMSSVVETADGSFALAGGGTGVGNNWLVKTTANVNSPSTSPAIAEFPAIAVLPLLVTLLLVAVKIRHPATHNCSSFEAQDNS